MNRRPVCFNTIGLLVGLTGGLASFGQQPNYMPRKFVRAEDPTEFIEVKPAAHSGFIRSYLAEAVQIYDLDADSTTYMMNRQQALLCIEGQVKNDKRDGLFTSYLIDAADHSKRYKIWEQSFIDNKLNGQWRIYSVRGGLVRVQTYKNDSLNGISRTYWIDGKGIMDEKEYFNGQNKFMVRTYSKDGKPEKEVTMEKGVKNGVSKYYYPSGQLWMEEVFKGGKEWEVRGSFTAKGQRRKMGTLKNGNGTVIFYNEDGTVRETKTFVGGVAK